MDGDGWEVGGWSNGTQSLQSTRARSVNFFICWNAYTKSILATTLQDIRLELAKEEAAEMAAGVVPQHKMSLTGFLTMGLSLEDRQ